MKYYNNIRDMLLIALHVALMIVCSWINVPAFVVPFTLQTLAMFISFRVLGGVKSLISIVIYVLIGALGFPAFSGMKGGMVVLMGPTGGYIFGFILSAVIYMFLDKIKINKVWFNLVKLFITLIVCYIVGTAWFMIVFGIEKNYTLWQALMTCVIPFILIDVAKMIIAEIIVGRLNKIFK